MKRHIVIFALLVVAGLPVAGAAQCSIGAWVEDSVLPKETMVRAGPGSGSRRIGEIPFAGADDAEETMIEITGYSNGWVRIKQADTIEGKEIFKGDGWIPATRVTTNVQTPTGKTAPLYSAPSKKAKRVGTVPADELVKIVGFNCFGFKISYKGKVGWIARDATCGNPVTTCV